MFFFFKQKTAYEMRISDWSSDVCSSDLHVRAKVDHRPLARKQIAPDGRGDDGARYASGPVHLNDRRVRVDSGRNADRRAERRPCSRSAERRVGKEGGSTCRCRWSPYHSKKTKQ